MIARIVARLRIFKILRNRRKHRPFNSSIPAHLRAAREELGQDHRVTQTLFAARVAEMSTYEREHPVPPGTLWWLSFAEPGVGLLGVAILEAEGPTIAMTKTHELGINPGGEVMSVLVPAETVPPQYRNRLLTRDEAKAVNDLNR